MSDLFGDVIYSYSREMAIADGTLIDVSNLAMKTGFKYPTAFTCALWEHLKSLGVAEKFEERILRVLDMAVVIAKYSANRSDTIRFKIAFPGSDTVAVKSVFGPGDDAKPVLTFMFFSED